MFFKWPLIINLPASVISFLIYSQYEKDTKSYHFDTYSIGRFFVLVTPVVLDPIRVTTLS